jgi:hypothetical protein
LKFWEGLFRNVYKQLLHPGFLQHKMGIFSLI